MAVQINQGTQTSIYTKTNAGTDIQVIKLDIGSGTAIADFGGTLVELSNQVKGTLSNILAGTVDTISQIPPNYWYTTVTTGTTTLGTIKAGIAGSAIFVTDVIISVGSATNLVLGMGGTSTPFIGTLAFTANGGLVSNYRVPGSVTSGSALVYQQSVGCSLSITAQGFVR